LRADRLAAKLTIHGTSREPTPIVAAAQCRRAM
jgi:hypothetical protein